VLVKRRSNNRAVIVIINFVRVLTKVIGQCLVEFDVGVRH